MTRPAQRSLRLRAPAKLNWTLEVLGDRPDGYHEVRTVLQTIALSDWVTISATLTPATGLSLTLQGEAGPLAGEPPDANLAYRAAVLLREEAGTRDGACIELEKGVPVAAGLGGGSSNAAAVLRGLRRLWDLSLSDDELASLGARLGADVPFFLRGGAALAAGRGDAVVPLPDGPPRRLVIAWPARPAATDKTARMYAALHPEHHTDGARTERVAARLRAGEAVADEDLSNVFAEALAAVDPEAARAFESAADLGRPHLAGSGPAFFFLLEPKQAAAPVLDGLDRLGLRAIETHTLSAAEAVASEEAL